MTGISDPSKGPFTVTPSDTVPFSRPAAALYVGTAGNVTLRGADGTADVVFKNVSAGAILPVQCNFVRATGTTATDIVGL